MTFRIGKNFHIIHMTGDLKELDAWYYDIFSVRRLMPDSYMPAEKRDASLVILGDLCVETLAPAFSVEEWDNMPLGRFYRRFGERYHSLAWYVDEGMQDLYDALRSAGVRCYTTGGVRVEGPEAPRTLFTHPHDTVAQLEFVPTDTAVRMGDPRHSPDWNPSWWADRHPLHITGFSHTTVTTRDLQRAKDIYIGVLKGELVYEGRVEADGSESAFVLVGDDLMVELAHPLSPSSPVAEDLERWGEGIFSICYRVADLAEAEAYLSRKGVKLLSNDGTTAVADPTTTHGCFMRFTTWSIPGDPRASWSAVT